MADHTVTVESTLEALLVEKKYSTIRDILSTMNPADIASVFDGLEESRLPLLFRLLPKELAAETFVEMEPDAQELLIRGFSDSELREVLVHCVRMRLASRKSTSQASLATTSTSSGSSDAQA